MLFFYFETYFCFTFCFMAPPPTRKTSNLWLNGLGSQHSGAQVTLSKQTIQWLINFASTTVIHKTISNTSHEYCKCFRFNNVGYDVIKHKGWRKMTYMVHNCRIDMFKHLSPNIISARSACVMKNFAPFHNNSTCFS